MRSRILPLLCSGALLLATGCPPEQADNPDSVQTPVQKLAVDFDQQVIAPTSVLRFRLRGTERIVAKSVVLDMAGELEGAPFRWSYSAQTADLMGSERPADEPGLSPGLTREAGDTGDLVLNIPVQEGLWSKVVHVGTAKVFTGTIDISVIDFFGDATAESRLEDVRLEFISKLDPYVAPVPGVDVYLDERVSVAGKNFLRPEEGTTYAVLERGVITHEDSTTRDLSGQKLALRWDGARDRARLLVDPGVLGVRVGTFEGDVRFVNELSDGTVVDGNVQQGVTFSIQQSFISTLSCGAQDPCPGGSRGQSIDVKGRGLVEPRGAVRMTLRFDGIFTPDNPDKQNIDFSGDRALERSPDGYVDDQKVKLSVWYTVMSDGGMPFITGLGALTGAFNGTITPVLGDGFGGTQEGLAWQGSFRVLPTRQVVYLKYLPRFSRGLDKYGLRNVENEIRARVLAAAQLPYKDVNVVFVDTPPVDFVDFATIELSGPDPYGRNAFGYDNSFNGVAKDTDNLFLADYIGGWSQGSADEFDNPFGGIYIESFDYFSAELSAKANGGAANEDASTDFDRIMRPFMPSLGGQPVRGTEWPGGPRSTEIEEAIHMVSSVIGNTVAHEIGHSMGMAFEPTDRVRPGMSFHNRDATSSSGALMDPGSARPFDERANLNGTPPAVFNQANAKYLSEILPLEQ